MSDSTKAVFLSYAREDAEPARRGAPAAEEMKPVGNTQRSTPNI